MCLKPPIDPAGLGRRTISSMRVNMRVKLEILLDQLFIFFRPVIFLMKYMLKSKNSSNTKDLNTQPKFSALGGRTSVLPASFP